MKVSRKKLVISIASISLGLVAFYAIREVKHQREIAYLKLVHGGVMPGNPTLNEPGEFTSGQVSPTTANQHEPVSHPYDADPVMNKALHYLGNDQWKEAEETLLEVLQKDPDHETAIDTLVTIYGRGMEDYPRAADEAERLLTLNVHYPLAIVRYGEFMSLAGRHEEAINFLRSIDTEGMYEIPKAIGEIQLQKGRPKEAVESLKEATRRAPVPEKGRLLEKLADSERSAQTPQAALVTLQKALDFYDAFNKTVPVDEPKSIQSRDPALFQYIEVAIELADISKVEGIIASLLAQDPANQKLLSFKGRIEAIKGQPLKKRS